MLPCYGLYILSIFILSSWYEVFVTLALLYGGLLCVGVNVPHNAMGQDTCMGTNQLGNIMKLPLCWWAGLSACAYSHMATLSILAGRRLLSSTHPHPVPRGWNQIQTPMAAEVWEAYLTSHPDRAYAEYLMEGIRAGFRIDFRYGEVVCRSSTSNMPSATVRPRWLVISSLLN